MVIDILYLRVSKEEEKKQDIEAQRKAVEDKFHLKNHITLEERGSAYDLDKISKRTEFLRLLEIIFNSKNTTIEDLYLNRIAKKDINLYVWDYHRIMRNFELNLLFGLLSDFFNIKIFSYKQGNIKKKEEETPIDKFARYIFYSINAFSSEDYSYHISENVKKTVRKKDGLTISNKGKKWGRKFKDLEGNQITLEHKQILDLNNEIKRLERYYKKRKIQFYYANIIKKIAKTFNISISKAYISKLK